MSAVMGLDADAVEAACGQIDGVVSVANYNCPGQIVITGEKKAVELAGQACKEAGAKRVIPLNVSGPFHSKMLEEAGKKLAEELKKVQVYPITVPYVSNVTADFVMDQSKVCELLQKQISSPVRWQQSIELMIQNGADEFVEIGPGHTLSGFLKKTAHMFI